MLPLNVVNDLDRLASEGIIDFDAAALLTGTRPRYIGNPQMPMLPPTEVPVNNGQFNQPSADTFMDPQTGSTGKFRKSRLEENSFCRTCCCRLSVWNFKA